MGQKEEVGGLEGYVITDMLYVVCESMLCINVCLYLVCLIVYRVMAHMHALHVYVSSVIFKYI